MGRGKCQGHGNVQWWPAALQHRYQLTIFSSFWCSLYVMQHQLVIHDCNVMDLKCVFVCVLHWIGFFIMHKQAENLLKTHSSINWIERNIVIRAFHLFMIYRKEKIPSRVDQQLQAKCGGGEAGPCSALSVLLSTSDVEDRPEYQYTFITGHPTLTILLFQYHVILKVLKVIAAIILLNHGRMF